MQERNYAREQVRQIARKVLISMLVLSAVVGLLLFKFSANPVNLFLGAASVSDLYDLQDNHDNGFFWVEGKVEYMTLWYTVTEDDRIVTRFYYWYSDDGGFVCVRSGNKKFTKDEYENITITGRITKPDEDGAKAIQYCIEEVAEYYGVPEEEAAEWVFPYTIDISASRTFERVIVAAGYLFLLFALWRILQSISHLSDYRFNKYYRKLGKDDEEREWVNAQVAADLEHGRIAVNQKTTKISPQWVLDERLFSFHVKRVSQLIWVYGSITQHRTNGIPTGKTYAVTTFFEDGSTIVLAVPDESEMRRVSYEILRLPGNRVFGFKPELKRMFKKDRQGFMELARQTREDFEAEERRIREAEESREDNDEE